MLNHLILGRSLVRPVRSWRLKGLPRKAVARSGTRTERTLRTASAEPTEKPRH